MLHRLAALSFMLPLLTAVACGGTSKHAESPASGEQTARTGPAEVGKPAPDLSIQALNGKGDMRLDGLSGKVVVVDFWATWCAPCRKSFPGLEALSKRHGEKVQVVGVSVNDEPDGITDFTKELGTTFPVGWDKGHSIAERWNVSTMPSSYVLDSSGTVRFVHAGYHEGDEVEIEKEVASLLGNTAPAGDPPAPPSGSDVPPPQAVAANTPPPSDDAAAADKQVDLKPVKKTGKQRSKAAKKKKTKKSTQKTPAS